MLCQRFTQRRQSVFRQTQGPRLVFHEGGPASPTYPVYAISPERQRHALYLLLVPTTAEKTPGSPSLALTSSPALSPSSIVVYHETQAASEYLVGEGREMAQRKVRHGAVLWRVHTYSTSSDNLPYRHIKERCRASPPLLHAY